MNRFSFEPTNTISSRFSREAIRSVLIKRVSMYFHEWRSFDPPKPLKIKGFDFQPP